MKIQRIENPISDDLFLEWHNAKNGELTPYMVSAHSHRKVWWKGKCGHEWQAVVWQRSKGSGCPYCSSRRVLKGFNDLATLRPDLAAEWNYEKNGSLTPDAVAIHSNKKVWWKGKCGHEWEAVVDKRQRGYGCPYCAGRRLKGFNDLATLHPDIAAEWNHEKNGVLTPEMVTAGSQKHVWWRCQKGHEWNAAIYSRHHGHGCPYCAGKKSEILSVVNPDIAAEWHPTKNGSLTPADVAPSSRKKVWWLGKCGHEWQAVVCQRTNGNGCPYCHSHRILKGFNDLATRNPAIAAEWHPTKNGSLSPTDVASSSRKRVWWIGRCGHEWEATVASRSQGNNCPYCSGQKVMAGFNDLATANPALAAEWHPENNGDITPEMVTAGCGKYAWWQCKEGHAWRAVIKSRNKGRGCPYCAAVRIRNRYKSA